jgi:integrase
MLTEHFKGKRLGDISQIAIEQFRMTRRSGLTQLGKPRSLNTINREMACLRKILALAVDNGYLERNPANLVPAYSVESRRMRVTSEEDDTIILSLVCEGLFARLFPIVILARYCGMRRSEILALDSDWIDFDKNIIFLPGEITKSGKSREIPMVGIVHEVLEERCSINGKVFDGYPSKERISGLFKQATVRAGIEGVTLHTLRHTLATRMEDYGIKMKEIRDILGHSPKSMTEHYQHSTRESRAKAIQLIEEHDMMARGTKFVPGKQQELQSVFAIPLISTLNRKVG